MVPVGCQCLVLRGDLGEPGAAAGNLQAQRELYLPERFKPRRGPSGAGNECFHVFDHSGFLDCYVVTGYAT